MVLTTEQLEMIKDYVIVPFKMDDPSHENRKAIDDYFSKEFEDNKSTMEASK